MYAEIQYDRDYSARKIYYHDFNYMTMCVYSTDESEDMWDKMPIRDLGFFFLFPVTIRYVYTLHVLPPWSKMYWESSLLTQFYHRLVKYIVRIE